MAKKKKKKLLKRTRPALKKTAKAKRKKKTRKASSDDVTVVYTTDPVYQVLLDIRAGIKRLVDLAEIEAQEKADDTPLPNVTPEEMGTSDDVDLGEDL